jgi:hypothetical protein
MGGLDPSPALVASLVPEIIRYVTPVIHMRRTTTHDAELGGQHIRAGDKVVMATKEPVRVSSRKNQALCAAFRSQWPKSASKAAAAVPGTRPFCMLPFVRLLVVIPPGGRCEAVVGGEGAWHAGR